MSPVSRTGLGQRNAPAGSSCMPGMPALLETHLPHPTSPSLPQAAAGPGPSSMTSPGPAPRLQLVQAPLRARLCLWPLLLTHFVSLLHTAFSADRNPSESSPALDPSPPHLTTGGARTFSSAALVSPGLLNCLRLPTCLGFSLLDSMPRLEGRLWTSLGWCDSHGVQPQSGPTEHHTLPCGRPYLQ